MSNLIRGLRAVSLLRVSTDKQTNEDNDIPGQRQLNQDFINRQGLLLVREFVEGGISGFKTKMANRDAIIQIELMAERKEFDVLVVYKSDRIGRTSDESPMIVKRLNDKNIRIFTANNEEIKTNTQMDKLMTYLTFWQNESESVKLSERVADYHKMLIHEGKYRGGTVPFGYMIVDNGTKNYKGRHIYDFIINPQEAEIVKLIYNLAIKGNMGSRSIAKYLNENGNLKSNGDGWALIQLQIF
jgi:DNA invertase Pin-like site-specific DNA recombinase